MVEILMMSATLATLSFLKIKVIWNKGYDVIISAQDAVNVILSRESNYICRCHLNKVWLTLALLWKKLLWPQFYKDVTRKSNFCFKFNSLRLALGMALKFYTILAKGLKLKVKVFGANSYFRRSYWGKTGRRGTVLTPIPERVKIKQHFAFLSLCSFPL